MIGGIPWRFFDGRKKKLVKHYYISKLYHLCWFCCFAREPQQACIQVVSMFTGIASPP